MNKIKLHNQIVTRHKVNIPNMIKRITLIVMLICIIFESFGEVRIRSASAATLTNVAFSVDYLEELVTITPGSGNSTKFYISTDGKTWELIEPFGPVDISTLLQSKEVTLYFRGNKDLASTEVLLQAENKSLKATYQVVSGVGTIVITNTTTLPVEVRKGLRGQWKTVTGPISTTLYELKGATLYFRLKASVTNRAGKEISLKIPKKPTAPSVKLDGSKLYISGLKIGETQYRVGDSSTWITFTSTDTKIKTIDLAFLFGGGANNTQIPAGVVEFRTLGVDKKISSSSKIFEVPLQPGAPQNAILSGTTLTIQDTNLKKAYEYSLVDKAVTTIDIKIARWTTITATRYAVVKNAEVGDKVLVRLKYSTDTATKVVTPASIYTSIPVSSISVK